VTLRRVLTYLTCLLFVEENDQCIYALNWISPFGWAHDLFYLKLPYQIRLYDHVLAVCLVLALGRPDGKGPRVQPMRSTLLLALGTIVAWFIYGMARDGSNFRWGCWQIYLPVSGVLFAFTIAAVYRTPEHYAMLAKAVLVAAAYRAIMCLLYYYLEIRTSLVKNQEYMTSHDDSVLWVVAIFILLIRVLRTTRLLERVGALLFMGVLVFAIQYNGRRLAWVSLAMGLVVFLLLLPPGSKALRRMKRAVMVMAPIMGLYVSIGWGRKDAIFKPLAAFSTITTEQDDSTKSRNYENVGLLTTARSNGWLVGTGWGHEYEPLSLKYDLSKVFAIWRYIPHNSILGLLTFMGVLGYTGYWLTFPTGIFLNSRIAHMAKSQAARDLGIIGAVQMVVCVNQYFGDMGLFSYKAVYVMGASYAIALRTPILADAWPAGARSKAAGQPPAQPPAARGAPVREESWQG
jgi:hypothetical protein